MPPLCLWRHETVALLEGLANLTPAAYGHRHDAGIGRDVEDGVFGEQGLELVELAGVDVDGLFGDDLGDFLARCGIAGVRHASLLLLEPAAGPVPPGGTCSDSPPSTVTMVPVT